MKRFKKLTSLLLALVMVCAMSVTALAANIEIQDANVGETYTAYQIFTATESSSGAITYYIDIDSAYYGDIVAMSNLASESQQNDDSYTQLFTLVGPNSDGAYQVTWNTSDNDAIIAYLVSLGAKGNKAGDVTATETDGVVSATITDLAAGYYFVTTSTGSVVSIGTTGTEEIQEKNGEPTPSKTVSDTENGTGASTNTAGIGDAVYYTVTISDADQIANLVVTDTLSAGLTLNHDVTVTVGSATVSATVTDGDGNTTTNYTVTYGTYNETTGTTLTITFENNYLDTLSSGDVITITYSAVVNANAVIDGDGNTNSVKLSYGNGQESTSTSTTTKVYDFNLSKTDGTDPLDGAEFTLSDSNGLISFVELTNNDGNVTGYRVATAEEKATQDATTTTIKAGSVNISGLDAGTYTLTETKAPNGYNQLSNSLTVTIDENGTVTFGGSNVTTVEVVNEAGSVLPSTGGIGTTIFYVVGTIMVLGAVVVLITRKRMSAE